MNAPFLKESPAGVYLAVKLQPRASRQQVSGIHGTELKISVTAPPVDAAANQALLGFLADLLDASRSEVELVRGQTSRHKTVFVRGLTRAKALEKLSPYLP